MKKIVIGMLLAASVCTTASVSAADFSSWLSGSKIGSVLEAAGPVIQVVQHTWDKESLRGIMQGRIAVPDETINDAVSQRLPADGSVKSLRLTSHENGRLDVDADTAKIGRVKLSGTIDAFVHDANSSYVTYTLKDKELQDHAIMSWFFSRISLSMLEKLVGNLPVSDDVTTNIKGNTLTVDFDQLLKKSDLGQASLGGYNLLDALCIESATPHDGYIEFKTSLNVPDGVKKVLMDVVQ